MRTGVQPARLVRALVVRVRCDVTHDAHAALGRVAARPAPRAAHRPRPPPRAHLQPAAGVRALVPVRVALVGAVRAARLRDGLASASHPEAKAGAGRPPPALLRAPQGVPQAEGPRAVLIPIGHSSDPPVPVQCGAGHEDNEREAKETQLSVRPGMIEVSLS